MSSSRNSVLWQLSRPDSHFVSYLMGTMHVKDSKAFAHIDRAKKLIDKSRLLACEFNLNDAQYVNHNQVIFLPDGSRLSEMISPRKYSKISKVLKKHFDMDMTNYDRFLPMIIISAISVKILSSNHMTSLDQAIWDYGIEKSLELVGVESYSQQLQIMSEIDLDYQLKSLLDILKNTKKFRRKINSLADLYKEEKIHALYKLSKTSLGKYRKLLLFDRNVRMCQKIKQFSDNNNCFIAVGAAHLSGKKGILHLLKKEGYKIQTC